MFKRLILTLLIGLIGVACSMIVPLDMSSDDKMQSGIAFGITSSNDHPFVGEVVTLDVDMMAREGIDSAELMIDVPKAFRLVEGSPTQPIAFAAGQQHSIALDVEVMSWPPTAPIEFSVHNQVVDYRAQWPSYISGWQPSSLRTVKMSESVAVELSANPAQPKVGQHVVVTALISSQIEASVLSGEFVLPEGLALADGALEWNGDLAIGESLEVVISAEVIAQPSEPIRFDLSINNNEVSSASYHFSETVSHKATLQLPPSIPSQIDWQAEAALPESVRLDAALPESAWGATPDNPNPVDFTIVANDDDSYTVYVFANRPIEDAQIAVSLPTNWQLLSGDTEWQGDLVVDEVVALDLIVNAPRSMTEEQIEVALVSAEASATQKYQIEPLTSNDNGRETAATRTYSGRFTYFEDLTNRVGTRANRVRVYDDDSPASPELICNTITDSNGYWSCSGSASDTFDDNLEVYAEVYSINGQYGDVVNANSDTYAFSTTERNLHEDSTTPHDFGTWSPPTVNGLDWDGAFHIFKMVYFGNTLMRAKGETPPTSSDSNFLTVVWPPPTNGGTSFYNNWQITLLGPFSNCGTNNSTCDPDEWDESVILHEYGHYIHEVVSDLDPPDVAYCNSPGEVQPNCGHGWNSFETEETAWIEGFANYFQSAAKLYWGMPSPEIYSDSSNSGTSSVSLETSRHPVDGRAWDTVESTIAGILYDIIDTPDDDQNSDGVGDELDMLFDDVHDTFSYYNPPGSTKAHPWHIEDFYTGFQSRNNQDRLVKEIFYEHGIDKNSAPTSVLLEAPSNGSSNVALGYDLDWVGSDPDGDNMFYDVYLEANDSSPDLLVGNNVDPPHYFVTGLKYNTLYYWKVVGRDIYGEEKSSSTFSFHTRDVSAPLNSLPFSGSENVSINVSVTWGDTGDPHGEALRFDVYVEADEPIPEALACSNITATSCALSLQYGTRYYWRVKAYDSRGNFAIGQTYSFTTEAMPTAVGLNSAETSPQTPAPILLALLVTLFSIPPLIRQRSGQIE